MDIVPGLAVITHWFHPLPPLNFVKESPLAKPDRVSLVT
jgi:hypothetical protein